ncbi:MAG TPA: alpha-2-macroglobulin family protein, partial [Anaerolineae bacterium]
TAELNKPGLIRIPVSAEGGALTTGIYLLHITSPEEGRNDFGGVTRHLLVVSNANLTYKSADREGLIWATDLQSGNPVAAGPVTLYDDQFQALGAGQTDASGLFKAEWALRRDPYSQSFVVLGQPGGTFGLAMSDWSDGIAPWDFNVNAGYFTDPYNVYIYTEKPLYRPGQPVHFKGIVRLDDDARYAIDPNLKQIDVTVNDSQGNQVYSSTLPLNDYGSFNADLTLDKEAGLGYYSILAQIRYDGPAGNDPQVSMYNGTFLVSEYRRPEFQVNVTTAKPEVLQGETIEVDTQANYYFGGAVTDAPVAWTALSENYYFDRYQGKGYFSWNDIDYFGDQSRTNNRVLASGEGKTDATGKFKITLPAKLDEKTGSQRFSIEASVSDINGQQVSGRVEVIVHQGRYYIGIAPTDYVGTAGKPMSFDLRSVDWQGEPAGQQKIDVVFYQREWFNAQQKDDVGIIFWTYSFSDTAVFTTSTTTTEGGEGQVAFTPPAGGEYRVVARGTDDLGHKISASNYAWVSSTEYVSWRQENNDRIALVADKKTYKPGDVAKILIPSPYQGVVKALITVERGRILDSKVIDLKSNSEVIEVPITAAMAPNAFVSVIIVKGVDQNDLAPSFKMGYASFTVSREQQELKITMTPDRDPKTAHYGPRDPISYTIKVLDYAGKPVQGEVSLALVDLSVLSLLDPLAQPISNQFYGERGLGVRTGSSLVFSVDRINVKLAEEAKGGGGGAAAEGGQFFVRGNFPDTAYWNATVTTDANGEAHIATQLPDNLTTWRMLAKAVTKDTLVGEGQVDVLSTRDLLIRPVTPRFMIVGDKFNMGAVINNNTSSSLQVEVTLEGTGITIDNGQVKQTVTIPANDKVRVDWPVTVLDAPYANLTFTARGGGFADASKPTAGLPPEQYLPIYKFSTPETTATAGNVTKDDPTRIEVVALPPKLDTTQGEFTLKIDPSLAAASTEGLKYLEHYPYECTEQTVSRFLPNVLTYRALKELGLADAALEANLKEQVGTGLQRLVNQQHTDGGWGWWVDDPSNLTVSTYVVFGLVKAKQSGFAVDDNVIERGASYLASQIVAPTQLDSQWKVNQQAYLLYVLAE